MICQHLKEFASSLRIYALVVILIGSWWYLAFKQEDPISVPSEQTPVFENSRATSFNHSLLTPMNRDALLKALSGNTSLMIKLMSEWDVDAQIMQSEGLHHAKRLSRKDYLRAQVLGRQLKNFPLEKLHQLQEGSRLKKISDDTGKVIDLKHSPCHFLPQTYAAASFLLALTPPEEIVALPRRLREQEQLFPRSVTNRIPLDCDRYNAEKLFLANPQVAFIAHYSHPATIQALSNQGVQLYTMRDMNTLTDICEELLCIGNVINRPVEAELLKIFIEAAMLAIDNRMASLQMYFVQQQKPPQVLFLSYHQTYSIPTRHTLTGQLLQRMGILDLSHHAIAKNESSQWSIPIDKEAILHLDPDCLIISTENVAFLKKEIPLDPALNQLSAVQNHRLFFVDEVIQQSPSQYIVLAYHDLIQALANLR